MQKTNFRYSISYRLSGCYLPDSHSGRITGTTRRELMSAIRYELEFYKMPKSLIREVKVNILWAHIKRHGSSNAHFSLSHKGNCLSFYGLTEEEYEQREREDAA